MAKLPDGMVALFHLNNKDITIDIESKELIKCKHCKYYIVEDVWSEIDGIPILAANQVPTCKRWARGCMTEPEGWCFMAEHGECG